MLIPYNTIENSREWYFLCFTEFSDSKNLEFAVKLKMTTKEISKY
jgi:hypothetical protein